MKNKFFYFFLILFFGCATVPSNTYRKIGHISSKTIQKGKYIEVKDFCKRYKAQYNYDTLDDMLTITSPSLDIKLLLASRLAYCNGRVISLKDYPVYSKGKFFIPSDIRNFIYQKEPKIKDNILCPLSVRTIIIDPGHGGRDPGAISKGGLREKDVNLKVSFYLKKELENKGFKVYMTRTKDIYFTLNQRVEFAKKYSGDLFISIHANANHSKNVNGLEVYYLSEKYVRKNYKALVTAENMSLGINASNFTYNERTKIKNIVCNKNNVRSVELANSLVKMFKKMGFKVKPPRGAPFYVLKYAYIPSVLFEMGYLSNSYEEKLLRQTHYQKQIAQGIALGVTRLNKYYVKLFNIK